MLCGRAGIDVIVESGLNHEPPVISVSNPPMTVKVTPLVHIATTIAVTDSCVRFCHSFVGVDGSTPSQQPEQNPLFASMGDKSVAEVAMWTIAA